MAARKITLLEGQFEVDHERGVVYFHANGGQGAETVTVLRICGLPKPIPRTLKKTGIDITLGEDKSAGMKTWFCDWTEKLATEDEV